LFFEVDHGPFVVDNNILLSRQAQLIVSQGGVYAHNLIAGGLHMIPFDSRMTPLHKAHSTELAGLHNNPCGDVQYYNNLFIQRGDVSPYDKASLPVHMAGNVFLKGAKACKQESDPIVKPDYDPELALTEKPDGWYLDVKLDKAWGAEQTRSLVRTEILGKAKVPDLAFENPDGSPIRISTDYFGAKRAQTNPFPGPFEAPKGGALHLKVWPVSRIPDSSGH
jgi:alpha-N-arabinofuranosidase